MFSIVPCLMRMKTMIMDYMTSFARSIHNRHVRKRLFIHSEIKSGYFILQGATDKDLLGYNNSSQMNDVYVVHGQDFSNFFDFYLVSKES